MLQDSPMYSYIPARDLARARQFYEGKLGFSLAQEVNGGVVYEFAKGTACFLYPTSSAKSRTSSGAASSSSATTTCPKRWTRTTS
jgi:catechol 2,3-dioxygenase-like lactoylglutathione lyase family enzyme